VVSKSKIAGLAFIAIAFGVIPTASAGTRTKEVNAKAGVPTLLFVWYDCVRHFPYQGTAFVENGTLTYKDAVRNRCGGANEPARELWYTSNSGFTGTDNVTVPGRAGAGLAIRVMVH
jgi:hypothetical protein